MRSILHRMQIRRGLERDFSNNKISVIRVSESIFNVRHMPRYQAFGSSRECTMISFSLALSLFLSPLSPLRPLFLAFFFIFTRNEGEKERYIYTYIYTSGGAYDETHRRWRGLEKEIPRDEEQKNLRRSECRNCHRAIGRKDRPTMLLCTVHSSPFRTF